jgi:PKD domain
MIIRTVGVLVALLLLAGLHPTWSVSLETGIGLASDSGIEASPLVASASTTDGVSVPCPNILPETLYFVGSASGGLPPYNFTWNFGDGSPPSYLQNPEHPYVAFGSYNVSLTVRDASGDVASATLVADVEPVPCPPPFYEAPPPATLLPSILVSGTVLMLAGFAAVVWYRVRRTRLPPSSGPT